MSGKFEVPLTLGAEQALEAILAYVAALSSREAASRLLGQVMDIVASLSQ